MKKFTLKVQTKGSIYKYRFNQMQSMTKYMAEHMRTKGKIERAWVKCNCHNIEEELSRLP